MTFCIANFTRRVGASEAALRPMRNFGPKSTSGNGS